ncbi:MAG: hypothetical protein AAFX06_32465 [Planctomycetota bacterium]
MSKRRRSLPSSFLLSLASVISLTGCAVVTRPVSESLGLLDRGEPDVASISQRADEAARVSNPPAQHIRFNGSEHLLGGGSCQAIPTLELLTQVRTLKKSKKDRSAALFVQLHRRSAQRLLLERTGQTSDPAIAFVAAVLDRHASQTLWSDHVDQCQMQTELALEWQTLLEELRAADLDSELQASLPERLAQLADQLKSPLLRIEALRLSGQLQAASEQTPVPIESLVSGAELASSVGAPSIASDLWLMASEASLRIDAVQQARKCWGAAVSSQIASLGSSANDQRLPSIDSVFWEQAVRLAHPGDPLPDEVISTLAPWCERLGIPVVSGLTPDTALWSAISEYQLVTGQPHLASLSLKRAESQAPSSARPMLQIALARAMAAQGQQAVAATILGRETESDDPNTRASALAVLGAIKIQSGAFEQGAHFVAQALAIEEATDWSGKLAAKADLANVQMIVGDLNEVLPTLHAVQAEMLEAQKWQTLCHSLENEAAMLELDGQTKAANAIRRRVEQLEAVAE